MPKSPQLSVYLVGTDSNWSHCAALLTTTTYKCICLSSAARPRPTSLLAQETDLPLAFRESSTPKAVASWSCQEARVTAVHCNSHPQQQQQHTSQQTRTPAQLLSSCWLQMGAGTAIVCLCCAIIAAAAAAGKADFLGAGPVCRRHVKVTCICLRCRRPPS